MNTMEELSGINHVSNAINTKYNNKPLTPIKFN